MGLLCIIFCPGLMLLLWIGGLLIRAAVWLANAAIGGSSPSEAGFYEPRGYAVDWQGRAQPHRGVPMPPIGKAMAIAFAVGVANFASLALLVLILKLANTAGIILAVRSRLSTSPEVQLQAILTIGVSFLVQSGILAALLPTSFGRACVVQVLNWGVSFLALVGTLVVLGTLHAVRLH